MATIKQAEQKVELRRRKWQESHEKLAKAVQSHQEATTHLLAAQGELIDAHGQGNEGGKAGKGNGGQKTPAQKKAMAGGPREEESELD